VMWGVGGGVFLEKISSPDGLPFKALKFYRGYL
jgi:hypothetical protein